MGAAKAALPAKHDIGSLTSDRALEHDRGWRTQVRLWHTSDQAFGPPGGLQSGRQRTRGDRTSCKSAAPPKAEVVSSNLAGCAISHNYFSSFDAAWPPSVPARSGLGSPTEERCAISPRFPLPL